MDCIPRSRGSTCGAFTAKATVDNTVSTCGQQQHGAGMRHPHSGRTQSTCERRLAIDESMACIHETHYRVAIGTAARFELFDAREQLDIS